VPIDATQTLGSGDIVAPPGVQLDTPEQRDLYRASMEFERFFLNHLMKQMTAATDAMKSQNSDAGQLDSSSSTYRDMANDQMVQSMLDGGGLGLSSVIYNQLAEQAGILGGGK
jgi:Rod binding domain-containing protein